MSVSCPNVGSWKQSLDLQPGCSKDLAHMRENAVEWLHMRNRKAAQAQGLICRSEEAFYK